VQAVQSYLLHALHADIKRYQDPTEALAPIFAHAHGIKPRIEAHVGATREFIKYNSPY
jgi:hypothetical protein